jgi:hypothetical protein
VTNPQPPWLEWAPAELAAAILPYFSSWEPQREGLCKAQIVEWLLGQRDHRIVRGSLEEFSNPAKRAVSEAIQRLEHACLLMRLIDDGDLTLCYLGLTRLGAHALQTNTVRQHLGLSDAPPTA